MPEAKNIYTLTGAERVELERLRTALDASGDVIYEWDLATDAVVWSVNANQRFGLPDTLDISTQAQFVTRINSEDVPKVTQTHNDHHNGRSPFQLEYRLRRGDGEFCWVQERGVVRCSAAGEPERAIGMIRIITPYKQREAHLEWLTSFDELTGHFNRTRLREALDHALAYADRYDAPGAYLALAITNLPLISEAYGHDIADAAVIAVGQALDECLRASDVVGRIAPDRFGIIISSCREDGTQVAAEKVLAAVQRAAMNCSTETIQITASVGAVGFPGTARTAHDAMIKAEMALEHARRAGHNRFVFYHLTEAQRRDRQHNLAIAKRVQTALQNGGMRFAFQPIVCGETGEVRFYECLLRMREPNGEHTVAGAFLGVAEEMGLVRLIDRRALELAIDELRASPDVTLAINISGLTTTDPAWLRHLFGLVKGRPDIARRLVIEITETAALHDFEETIRFVAAVRDAGCRIALDDFGAGYTSFRHLKALAVDVVKIDGSFVTNLADQPQDFLFVKTLQDLARGFGLKTVAECVETEEVARMLADEGVHYLQGYFFGRPSFERPWLNGDAGQTFEKLAVGHS
ncbi:MAG: putative bifunctional diguanylate cyclase/phosphodiesterase [Alphaproteobacteria bacterium]